MGYGKRWTYREILYCQKDLFALDQKNADVETVRGICSFTGGKRVSLKEAT